MKKIFLIAFACAAFSNMASAQAKVNPAMTPPPPKEQIEKDNNTKAASVEKLSAPAPGKASNTDANRANYKKAGLNDSQIAQVEKSVADLDQRKAAIENDNSLTPEQKKNGLAAVETERSAVLKKSMGEDGYKRYTIVTQNESKGKPAKAAPKKTTAN